jgi:UDP:flavonoid glycosyltransferase YjiC (YdhE family)
MFPTNGVGFGHFTRMLAVARRMKKLNTELNIVFFTTMPTLHLLIPEGIPVHHISGQKQYSNMDSQRWNALVEEELTLAFEVHNPGMFIFDGAFPYRGLLRAIKGQQMQKIWLRRGTFRAGSSIPVDSIEHFDLIVHPEDSVPLAPSEVDHEVEVMTCPPITLLDEDELLFRRVARHRLMLPLDATVVYVQLGAGAINDIDSEVRITVEALTRNQGVHVILGESMIGERIDISLERVHIIRDYPNAMYFRAFDATVQAGGYNSFHETRNHGLPTLFYPNMETGMDDQLARCLVAAEEGWGSVLKVRDEKNIEGAVEELLNLIGGIDSPDVNSGAWSLARSLIGRLGGEFDD